MHPLARRLVNYDDPRSLGSRMRARRGRVLVDLVRAVHAERGRVSILDVGGTKRYWNALPGDVLEACDVRITLLNLPGTDVGASQRVDDARFTVETGDGCDLSRWDDDAFDVAHSNSVIEHVGDWSRMKAFAREMRRVGRHHFVQTPNFWFPVEPHAVAPFFHWLPRPWRVRWVMRSSLGNWSRQETVDGAMRTIESSSLLDRRMMRELFPEGSTIRTERFFGLPKSLTAVGAGATVRDAA